jgi:hypothetical protein
MTTSRIPALIDYLVTTFTNAATLGQATPPVTVYDGPQTTEAPASLVLWVGLDDPDTDQVAPSAAASQQEWAGLGKQARNEISTIHCVAEAWTGADDIKGMRTAAFAIAGAVEDIVRTDPFSGLALFPDPGVTGMELRQNNTQSGSQARVSFQIAFKSRIGG